MSLLNLTHSGLVALVLANGLIGCGGPGSSTAPSQLPSAQPSAVPPTVASFSVNTGSTRGGTPLRIVGAGFQMGVTITFGTVAQKRQGYDPRVPGAAAGSIIVNTPAHAVGLVDLILTNPDGGTVRLANAYEFLPQESFDFNGNWDGVGSDGNHIGMALTIRNNVLVAASCDGDAMTAVNLQSGAANGEFSAETGDFRISGRIVSPSDAIGKITAPSCGTDVPWVASRSPR